MEKLIQYYEKNISQKAILSKKYKILYFIDLVAFFMGLALILLFSAMVFYRLSRNVYHQEVAWILVLWQFFSIIDQILTEKVKKIKITDLENRSCRCVSNYYETWIEYSKDMVSVYLEQHHQLDEDNIKHWILRLETRISKKMISSLREFNIFFWVSAAVIAYYVTKYIDVNGDDFKFIVDVMNFNASVTEFILVVIGFTVILSFAKLLEYMINRSFIDLNGFFSSHQRNGTEAELLTIFEILHVEILKKKKRPTEVERIAATN